MVSNSATCAPLEAEAERERAAVRALQARRRVDLDADDLLGRLGRDFLDVHAARRRRDERDAARVAVEQQAEVQLAIDLRAGLDVDLVDRQAVVSGLLGDEALADHAGRGRLHVVDGLDDLHAARLAAPTGVHLRLDDPYAPAEPACRIDGLLGRGSDEAGGHRDAVAGEQLLGLVFVQVHEAGRAGGTRSRSLRPERGLGHPHPPCGRPLPQAGEVRTPSPTKSGRGLG